MLKKTTYAMLLPGDDIINPDTQTGRTVKRIDMARAKGYLCILFQDGTRTSGHESTECYRG